VFIAVNVMNNFSRQQRLCPIVCSSAAYSVLMTPESLAVGIWLDRIKSSQLSRAIIGPTLLLWRDA
jgi:hypothetical protein